MKPDTSEQIILPDWQVPAQVKAFSTTRAGGVSGGVYSSNNLALHVGDNKSDVLKNRALLRKKRCKNARLPAEPFWLNQTHTTTVVNVAESETDADASYSKNPGEVCVVMTADCLPVLLTDKQGRQVAAIHAGWRGLLNGVIENALTQFSAVGSDIVAWLGPAIGPKAFEVGAEVRDGFVEQNIDVLPAFRQCSEDKWLANIYALARMRLKDCGVTAIYGGDYCTYHDEPLFYSYRRDKTCGRMATLIWLDK